MIYLVAGVSFLAGAGVGLKIRIYRRKRTIKVVPIMPSNVRPILVQRYHELSDQNPHLATVLGEIVERSDRRARRGV